MLAAPTTIGDITGSLIYGVLILVGVVIGWFLGNIKTAAEIRKLHAEKTKLEKDQVLASAIVLKQFHDRLDRCVAAQQECDRIIDQLLVTIRPDCDFAQVAAFREDFCRQLCYGVVHEGGAAVEVKKLVHAQDNPAYYAYVLNSMLPLMERWEAWLRVINKPKLLERINKRPYSISRMSLQTFLDAGSPLEEPQRIQVLARVEAIAARLADAANPVN